MAARSETGGPAWSPVRVRHASRSVVDQIKEAVLAGRAEPGDWIGSEKSLAEELGVGRSTIREAVKALEAQGLVTVETGAGGGIRVALPQSAYFSDALAIQLTLMKVGWRELLDTQVALESTNAAAAATVASDDDVRHLQDLLARAEPAVGDPERFARLGVDFHIAVADVAGNRVLSFFLTALSDLVTRRYAERSTSRKNMRERHQRIVAQHRTICEAIAKGDSHMTMKHMSEHLHETRRAQDSP